MAEAKMIDNWYDFLNELKAMGKEECVAKYGNNIIPMWDGLQTAKEGEVVIRILEGGNEIMAEGSSKCGITPGIQVDVPIVLRQPDGGWYKGGVIESIDWEAETFKTAQSTYSFHFVKH